MKRAPSFVFFATCTFVFLLASSTSLASLSKKAAFEMMKKNGFKWQQISNLIAEANSKAGEAESALRPHVNFFARQFTGQLNQIQYGFSSPGALNWLVAGSTGLEFGYQIIDFSAVERLRAAQENQVANAATAEQYKNDLTYFMLVQYLNVQRLKKNLALATASIERDEKILDLAQQKVKSGAGARIDLSRAEGLVQRDRLKELDARSSLEKACSDLAGVIGERDFNCDVAALKLNLLKESDLPQAAHADLERADLKAAHSAKVAATHLRDFADQEASPKLGIYGEAGMLGATAVGGANTSFNGIVGIQLTFPIYDGGYRSNRVQEENVKVVQADLQEKQLKLDTTRQLELALNQYREAKSAVEVAEKNKNLSQEEFSASRQKFLQGASSALDLNFAQTSVASAEELNTQAIFTYELAKVNYFNSAGHIDRYFEVEEK